MLTQAVFHFFHADRREVCHSFLHLFGSLRSFRRLGRCGPNEFADILFGFQNDPYADGAGNIGKILAAAAGNGYGFPDLSLGLCPGFFFCGGPGRISIGLLTDRCGLPVGHGGEGDAPEATAALPDRKIFKGVFLVAGGKGVTVNFMDSRMWGGKDFSFTVAGPAKWTPKAVEHPAGSIFSWEFTLSFEPEK